MNRQTRQFLDMMTLLTGISHTAQSEQLELLCAERWVIGIQAKTDSHTALMIRQLIELLDRCGYQPSYAWFDSKKCHLREIPVQQSPFSVVFLPSELELNLAKGLTIHTLIRDLHAPCNLGGAILHPLAKVVTLKGDVWANKQFSASENISQFVSLAHNEQSEITDYQQLIAAAALHVGVVESVSLNHFKHYD